MWKPLIRRIGNTKQGIQDYDTVFDNSFPFRKNDLHTTDYVFQNTGAAGPLRLHFQAWHRGSGCDGAAAPVTGAAADVYNLNVVDCNASLSHAGLPSQSVGVTSHKSQVTRSGRYPVTHWQQPPEANVKDNGFPWPPPGPGNFSDVGKRKFLR